jgi:N-succinyl-L-ornithine transcarbamylase
MKNFININDIKDYNKLVDNCISLKKSPYELNSLGINKTLGLLFFNPSLRTRISTEKAAKILGMNVISMNFNNEGWNLEYEDGVIMNSNKAEHIKDAARVVGQYCDIIGIRSFPSLINKTDDEKDIVINSFKKYANIPVINLESSIYHPLQALADAVTIKEKVKKPKIVLSWAPHIKPLPHAVANSFINMVKKMNYDIKITNPIGYNLNKNITDGIEIINNQKEAFEGANLIYAKNWSCYENYGKVLDTNDSWIIDDDKMNITNNAKFMHCLPVRRNLVVSDSVIDSDNSLVVEQSNNRVYSAQLILKNILNEI